jgi:hypothetical protein
MPANPEDDDLAGLLEERVRHLGFVGRTICSYLHLTTDQPGTPLAAQTQLPPAARTADMRLSSVQKPAIFGLALVMAFLLGEKLPIKFLSDINVSIDSHDTYPNGEVAERRERSPTGRSPAGDGNPTQKQVDPPILQGEAKPIEAPLLSSKDDGRSKTVNKAIAYARDPNKKQRLAKRATPPVPAQPPQIADRCLNTLERPCSNDYGSPSSPSTEWNPRTRAYVPYEQNKNLPWFWSPSRPLGVQIPFN